MKLLCAALAMHFALVAPACLPDAREVAAGYECGIGLSDFQDLKAGDIIETFDEVEVERT